MRVPLGRALCANTNDLQTDDLQGHPEPIQPLSTGNADSKVFPPPSEGAELPQAPTAKPSSRDIAQGRDAGRPAPMRRLSHHGAGGARGQNLHRASRACPPKARRSWPGHFATFGGTSPIKSRCMIWRAMRVTASTAVVMTSVCMCQAHDPRNTTGKMSDLSFRKRKWTLTVRVHAPVSLTPQNPFHANLERRAGGRRCHNTSRLRQNTYWLVVPTPRLPTLPHLRGNCSTNTSRPHRAHSADPFRCMCISSSASLARIKSTSA